MSRTRGHGRPGSRGYPVCRGCSACSWWPRRMQRAGKRTGRVVARELIDEVGVVLTGDDPSWWDDAAEDAELTSRLR